MIATLEESLRAARKDVERAALERDALTDQLAAMRHASPTPATTVHAPTPTEPDTEWIEMRLVTRYGFADPIEVQVNGTPGQLCDLSVTGCQLLSATALKPSHTVNVLLPVDPEPVRCSGRIVWAKLETPTLGRTARYRAGVEFARPDESAIETFIIRGGGAPRD